MAELLTNVGSRRPIVKLYEVSESLADCMKQTRSVGNNDEVLYMALAVVPSKYGTGTRSASEGTNVVKG